MKGFVKVLLAAAVLSGTVSFRTYKDGDTLTIETTVSNQEAMLETAGSIVSVAGDVLHSFEQAVTGQSEANAPDGEPVIYRIRNVSGEAASQIGAYYDLNLAKQVCPAGYCVFDAQNQLIYAGGNG